MSTESEWDRLEKEAAVKESAKFDALEKIKQAKKVVETEEKKASEIEK